MAKKRPYKPLPPAPGHPGEYIIVNSKEGQYWRRKRGTVTKAKVNAALKKNNELAAIASPAAKRIRDKLAEFTKQMDTGRFIARVSGRLMKALRKNGAIDYSFLDEYELQPDRRFSELVLHNLPVLVQNGEVIANFSVKADTVKQHIKSVTGFYFDLVLLYGDPTKNNGLRIESDTSPVYPFDMKNDMTCRLSVTLPTKKIPWMALLRAGCMKGQEVMEGDRYCTMKVMAVG